MANETSDRARKPGGFLLDGKQKVTITLAGLSVAGALLIATHTFLARHTSKYFVQTASAQEAHGDLTRQIRDASDAANKAASAAQQAVSELRSHVAGEDLNRARSKIDTLRGEISATQLWESTNGANEISRARRQDLERQLERTIAYAACLEAQRPNCAP